MDIKGIKDFFYGKYPTSGLFNNKVRFTEELRDDIWLDIEVLLRQSAGEGYKAGKAESDEIIKKLREIIGTTSSDGGGVTGFIAGLLID